MGDKPIVLAWITCDGVHLDPASGKYYLLGVFSSIRARSFPVTHPRMFCFLVLTGVDAGSHGMRILFNLPTDEPRVIAENKFESQSPVDRIHLINEIHDLSLAEEGNYSLMIEIDDDPVMATNFIVSQ